jgi:hypothetical protein
MDLSNLERWADKFREAAEDDECALLRDHLCRLELPETPELLLEGTIQVIFACIIYANLDGKPFDAFLRMQHYDPSRAHHAPYAFTFDLFGKAFGRVLYSRKAGVLDLADLYGHSWNLFGVSGYDAIHITRSDGRELSKRELARLEKEVTEDLRYDYEEDELDIGFDSTRIEGSLIVTLRDRLLC